MNLWRGLGHLARSFELLAADLLLNRAGAMELPQAIALFESPRR